MKCKTCGENLGKYGEGATKKFFGKGETEYMCLDCIARKMNVSKELLEKKIEEYKAAGCTLFPK